MPANIVKQITSQADWAAGSGYNVDPDTRPGDLMLAHDFDFSIDYDTAAEWNLGARDKVRIVGDAIAVSPNVATYEGTYTSGMYKSTTLSTSIQVRQRINARGKMTGAYISCQRNGGTTLAGTFKIVRVSDLEELFSADVSITTSRGFRGSWDLSLVLDEDVYLQLEFVNTSANPVLVFSDFGGTANPICVGNWLMNSSAQSHPALIRVVIDDGYHASGTWTSPWLFANIGFIPFTSYMRVIATRPGDSSVQAEVRWSSDNGATYTDWTPLLADEGTMPGLPDEYFQIRLTLSASSDLKASASVTKLFATVGDTHFWESPAVAVESGYKSVTIEKQGLHIEKLEYAPGPGVSKTTYSQVASLETGGYAAQGFIATSDMDGVMRVTANVLGAGRSATFMNNISFRIYNDNAGKPGSSIGSLNVAGTRWRTTASWISVDIPLNQALAEGSKYWIVIYSGPYVSGQYLMYYTAPVTSGGLRATSSNGTSWSLYTTSNVSFSAKGSWEEIHAGTPFDSRKATEIKIRIHLVNTDSVDEYISSIALYEALVLQMLDEPTPSIRPPEVTDVICYVEGSEPLIEVTASQPGVPSDKRIEVRISVPAGSSQSYAQAYADAYLSIHGVEKRSLTCRFPVCTRIGFAELVAVAYPPWGYGNANPWQAMVQEITHRPLASPPATELILGDYQPDDTEALVQLIARGG